MNEQNHELKTFGPQFLIDTGNETMFHSGKTVYFIQGITKDKVKNNISFHETGFARYYTENILQVESGVRCKDNEDAFRQIVHHGNYDVNADTGEIRLAAQNIVIEATDNLSLLGSKTIQIAYPEQGATKEVLTYAKNESKWLAANEYCKDRNRKFLVWTEDHLKELGIKLLTPLKKQDTVLL